MQTLCIWVDSAGCMSANDPVSYVSAMQGVTSVPLGFHGRDNLG